MYLSESNGSFSYRYISYINELLQVYFKPADRIPRNSSESVLAAPKSKMVFAVFPCSTLLPRCRCGRPKLLDCPTVTINSTNVDATRVIAVRGVRNLHTTPNHCLLYSVGRTSEAPSAALRVPRSSAPFSALPPLAETTICPPSPFRPHSPRSRADLSSPRITTRLRSTALSITRLGGHDPRCKNGIDRGISGNRTVISV